MHKILFVVPPCFLSSELDFEIGFPVHLALLGRVAREEGWSASYLDMTLEEKEGLDSFSTLAPLLQDSNLRLVGISNHTVRTSVTTRSVAERIKSIRPDVKIVVGGVNATFMTRELLESCTSIDYIVRGHGQPVLTGLLRGIDQNNLSDVRGLISQESRDSHSEPLVPVAREDFATPSLEGLQVSRYLEWTRTYPLLTHTGCGFSCNFCTSVMPGPYQNREVYRTPADVVTEMTQAIDLGFDRFFISDNVFTSNRLRCIELCNSIQFARIPERATWVCMTRVEFIDEELLRAMQSAGCVNIAFGVESATEDQWKSLRKGRFSNSTVRKAFSLARQAGIGTTAYLMLGNPSQTQQDLDATVELVREVDPDYRVVSFFQPFPGTQYWTSPEIFGLSELDPLGDWNFHESPICRTRHLSKEALIEGAIRLYLESATTGPLDPRTDFLVMDNTEQWDSSEMPEPARGAFLWAKEQLPVAEILDRVCRKHGTRGRLIALYWLAAAARIGAIRQTRHRKEGVYA